MQCVSSVTNIVIHEPIMLLQTVNILHFIVIILPLHTAIYPHHDQNSQAVFLSNGNALLCNISFLYHIDNNI